MQPKTISRGEAEASLCSYIDDTVEESDLGNLVEPLMSSGFKKMFLDMVRTTLYKYIKGSTTEELVGIIQQVAGVRAEVHGGLIRVDTDTSDYTGFFE